MAVNRRRKTDHGTEGIGDADTPAYRNAALNRRRAEAYAPALQSLPHLQARRPGEITYFATCIFTTFC
jgi:hypothetical protein